MTAPVREPRGWRRPGRLLELALALVFLGGGAAKLAGLPAMVTLFAAIGVGQWLRYVTGTTEMLGGLLLLRPALAPAGAVLLIGVMAGATATNAVILHFSPLLPGAVLVALAVVAASHRGELLSWAKRMPRWGSMGERATPPPSPPAPTPPAPAPGPPPS